MKENSELLIYEKKPRLSSRISKQKITDCYDWYITKQLDRIDIID